MAQRSHSNTKVYLVLTGIVAVSVYLAVETGWPGRSNEYKYQPISKEEVVRDMEARKAYYQAMRSPEEQACLEKVDDLIRQREAENKQPSTTTDIATNEQLDPHAATRAYVEASTSPSVYEKCLAESE